MRFGFNVCQFLHNRLINRKNLSVMKKSFTFSILMFFCIFGCKPISVADLQDEYIKNQIKIVKNGGVSQFDLETLLKYKKHVDSIKYIKPKCPIGPLPSPKMNGDGNLVFNNVKRITAAHSNFLEIKTDNSKQSKFITNIGKENKCGIPPIYKINLKRKTEIKIEITTEFLPAVNGKLSFPVYIKQ